MAMQTYDEQAKDVWRILLFANNGSELLVLKRPHGLCLPELRIPQGQRVAPHLHAEAKRVWNLETVCLKPLELPYREHERDVAKYHVMELRKSQELARIAPDSVYFSAVRRESFADSRDYRAVHQAMKVKDNFPERPFSDFGAFEKIHSWVAEQLRSLGMFIDGSFRQLQADGSFALIRFATDRDAVWFKAVGQPNLREFAITRLLAARVPAFLPELLAERKEWNAWLVAEAQGQGLYESFDPAVWARAAEALAGLQTASVEHAQDFLDAGAHDVRTESLARALKPFFSGMEDVAEAQVKSTARKLSVAEIGFVREQLAEALEEIQEAAIPDSLNHLDLNPCNVVVGPAKCTFLDWAEAAVGCPLFSIEYLRQQFLQAFPADDAAQDELLRFYLQRWASILGHHVPQEILYLIPLTATYAFAVSALAWRSPESRRRPELAAYLRSLLRRMHRECEQIRTNRAA
jgi:hypothetical protein